MGTRGYRLVRFRGRYYRFYNHLDSYPSALGRSIVDGIPSDPTDYAKWLAGQRAKAADWDAAVQNALCIKPPGHKTEGRNTPSSVSSEEEEMSWYYDILNVDRWTLPCYIPVFNDLMIEWVYVVDLDQEIFTVDHGAHFVLDRIPEGEWMTALAEDKCGNRLVLPDLVPGDTITSLDAHSTPANDDLLEVYRNLVVKTVVPKGIDSCGPGKRHGRILCARLFQMFQRTHKMLLAHLLRGWQIEELQFREIAYAMLCLSSGSQYVSLEASTNLRDEIGCGYAVLQPDQKEKSNDSETVAYLASGCHREGYSPGSAPETSMYWFENALICLVAQLERSEIAAENIARIARYCWDKQPHVPVNAVMISIEHIMLLRVYNKEVEQTELLPLFALDTQPSMDPRARYSETELANMQQRVLRYRARKDQPSEQHAELSEEEYDSDGDDPNGSISFSDTEFLENRWIDHDICATEPTFHALAHFLDCVQRQSLAHKTQLESRVPPEIRALFREHLDNTAARNAAMRLSLPFIDAFQETVRFNDDMLFLPNPASMTYLRPMEFYDRVPKPSYPNRRKRELERNVGKAQPPALRAIFASTGTSQDFTMENVSAYGPRGEAGKQVWRVVIGNERDRRSVLRDIGIVFTPVQVGGQ